MLTDGPHGLRKREGASDHLGVSGSVPPPAFPPAVALAQNMEPRTWRAGPVTPSPAGPHARGVGCPRPRHRPQTLSPRRPGNSVLLEGRCSPDIWPQPSSTACRPAAWVPRSSISPPTIKADRMQVSADIDEQPARVVPARLPALVRTAAPWTVMCSYYNKDWRRLRVRNRNF